MWIDCLKYIIVIVVLFQIDNLSYSNSKSLSNYSDSKGFIGHGFPGHLEFGDSTQRLGTIWIKKFVEFSNSSLEFKRKISNDFLIKLEMVHLESGEWVRHWDHSQWPGQPGIMSLDQMDPILMAMILWAPYNDRIERLAKDTVLNLIKRGGFLWNTKTIWPHPGDKPKYVTDWFGPSILSHAIRLWKIYPLYVLLPSLDIPLIFNSLFRSIAGLVNRNDVGDDLNHQLRLVFNKLSVPSFVGNFATFLYKKFRPTSKYPDGTLSNSDPIKAVWQIYYAGIANPPLDIEWEFVQDRIL